MFYLIRIIFIILLLVILLLSMRAFLKKQVKGGKNLSKRFLVTTIIIVVVLFETISILSFIPFEAPFIHFDSIEDSLKYKWINPDDITICDENDCAFAVKGTYDIYSFEKINDKYGFVNYHSKINKYKMPDVSSYNSDIHNLYSAYNQTANKTFYLLNIGAVEYQDDMVKCSEVHFEYFAQLEITPELFGNAPIFGPEYQVYAITDGEPLDILHVEFDSQAKTFLK